MDKCKTIFRAKTTVSESNKFNNFKNPKKNRKFSSEDVQPTTQNEGKQLLLRPLPYHLFMKCYVAEVWNLTKFSYLQPDWDEHTPFQLMIEMTIA